MTISGLKLLNKATSSSTLSASTFAVLMFGMRLMSDAVSPLADMPQFSHLLVAFRNPLLGVLVGAVMLAFFDWRVFVIAFALFILSVVLTKWISLGSILGAVSFPITTWLFYRDPVLTAMAFGMAAAVVFMHRSNIGRILHGTENKFSFKSKKTIEASPDREEK